MHNALFNNNNKSTSDGWQKYHFLVKLDFLNFAPLMKVDDSFCQKRPLFAGWVELFTGAFKKAAVMENLE